MRDGRTGRRMRSPCVDRFVLVPAVKRVLSDFLPQLRGAAHLDLDRAAAARSADVEPAAWGRVTAFSNGLHHTHAHRSMAEFDDATIAPMMGCPDALTYYSEASASRGGIATVESMAESAPSREWPAETSVRPFWCGSPPQCARPPPVCLGGQRSDLPCQPGIRHDCLHGRGITGTHTAGNHKRGRPLDDVA